MYVLYTHYSDFVYMFSDNVLLFYVYMVSCVDLYLIYLYVADKAFFILKIFGGLSKGSPEVLSHPHPLQ